MLVVSTRKAVRLIVSSMYTGNLNGRKPLHIIGPALAPCTLRPPELQAQNAPATFIRELTADCRRFESSLAFIYGDHFLESLIVPCFMHSKAGARHCVLASRRSVPFQVHAVLQFSTCFICK